MAARNIIRFVKSAKISFSELDNNAAGACEFYRHMTARKTHAVNPKCNISFEPVLSGTVPTIDLHFIDNEKHTLKVENRNINDIFEEVESFCTRIETQYEIDGKSIEP